MGSLVYLDHCSTTPVDPRVLKAMLPYFSETFGNPSTPHHIVGTEADHAVRQARKAVASLINADPNELIWTSGATESNNIAILGAAMSAADQRGHIVTQVTEHSSVLEPCRHLETAGWAVTYLPVDRKGRINLQELSEAVREDTALVSIMWGNNEIGTIQPIEETAMLWRERRIPVHCDAAQAMAKLPIDVANVPVEFLTISAHKMYGPKGCGALYIRDLPRRKAMHPIAFGGGQEGGLRSGTLNVPGIVGLGAACELAASEASSWRTHVMQLRDLFEKSLMTGLDGVSLNGDQHHRLPHISSLAFSGVDNEGLLAMLPDIVASTGSACHVASFEPSHVLTALRKEADVVDNSLRFGFGKDNTEQQVTQAVDLIVAAVKKMRADQ